MKYRICGSVCVCVLLHVSLFKRLHMLSFICKEGIRKGRGGGGQLVKLTTRKQDI